MQIDVFFPTISEMSPQDGELRLVSASLDPSEPRAPTVYNAPESKEEVTQVRQAHSSLLAWRSPPGGHLTIGLQSKRASKDTSLHLAVAAAAWAACRRARPRGLLVATGALPDAATVRAHGRLAVLGVGGVGRKARVVAGQLAPGGTLWAHVEPNSQSGYANLPVMFVYPKAAALDAEDMAALAALAALGVQVRAIDGFADLLALWLPDEAGGDNEGKIKSAPPRWPAFAAAAAIVALVAGAAVWRVAPEWLDRTIALARVPPTLRTLSITAAADPDAPERGCKALIDPAAPEARGEGWGWRGVNHAIDACQAVLECDQRATSPMESRTGSLLSQLTANRDYLREARATCAAAARAYPAVPRFAYQQWRALSADGDPTTARAAAAALARAAELQYAPAVAEQTRALAATDPALARARLERFTGHADPEPDANLLRAHGELLACGALGPPGPGDAERAARLLDRAAAPALAPDMHPEQRGRLRDEAASLRDPTRAGPPQWCGVIVARAP